MTTESEWKRRYEMLEADYVGLLNLLAAAGLDMQIDARNRATKIIQLKNTKEKEQAPVEKK